ncbi:hypothetical protein Taro_026330 [Colocasia esculenta]|uniref:Uncharacterized protein n=1 Tax=Colocasia esculenta TaxID=4460 RepID=A0A843VCL5_COLES|nr:hypothetical protein [Colocasia esculenta]
MPEKLLLLQKAAPPFARQRRCSFPSSAFWTPENLLLLHEEAPPSASRRRRSSFIPPTSRQVVWSL